MNKIMLWWEIRKTKKLLSKLPREKQIEIVIKSHLDIIVKDCIMEEWGKV